MKRKIFRIGLAFGLAATGFQAQAQSEVEVLKRQLKEATDNFQKTIEQHRLIIESLNKRLDALQQQQTAVTNEQQKLKQLQHRNKG